MRSNLPLLFVNGYPTSLSKMSVGELERFIPFMVQCSLGHDKISNMRQTPKWWPEEIPYPKAFIKSNNNDDNWKKKLKSLVLSCYSYHDCNFLLHFCSDLSAHPKNTLRFVNNCDSTTSLFHKGTGKLLVTFRNENILYDKIIPARKRKLLKPQTANVAPLNSPSGFIPTMVEEDPVDIYLCDNCDAVMHSSEEMREHEERCREQDSYNVSPQDILDVDQENFLHYFALSNHRNGSCSKLEKKSMQINLSIPNGRKRDGRSGIPQALIRSAAIPFSSPAGILLTRRSRHFASPQTHIERRERAERYCHAPALADETPSWLHESTVTRPYVTTYRKSQTSFVHRYKFPKSLGKPRLDVDSQIKFLHCGPCSVRVKCKCELFCHIAPEIIDLCSSDDDDLLEDMTQNIAHSALGQA